MKQNYQPQYVEVAVDEEDADDAKDKEDQRDAGDSEERDIKDEEDLQKIIILVFEFYGISTPVLVIFMYWLFQAFKMLLKQKEILNNYIEENAILDYYFMELGKYSLIYDDFSIIMANLIKAEYNHSELIKFTEDQIRGLNCWIAQIFSIIFSIFVGFVGVITKQYVNKGLLIGFNILSIILVIQDIIDRSNNSTFQNSTVRFMSNIMFLPPQFAMIQSCDCLEVLLFPLRKIEYQENLCDKVTQEGFQVEYKSYSLCSSILFKLEYIQKQIESLDKQ